jgi:hypothetical protein
MICPRAIEFDGAGRLMNLDMLQVLDVIVRTDWRFPLE